MTDEDYYKAVGANIKKIRLKKGIKQIELANICEFDRQHLFKIESGELNLTLKTLKKLAENLDVTVIDLLKIKTKK